MEKRVVFGWLFLLIGITPFITFLTFNRPQYAVWFSNHTFIILGLALLLKSPFWAFAQLCLGAIPELVWSADFLYRFFTGSQLLGITEYMFKNGSFDLLHVYSLQHILFVPAALYSVYLLKGPVKQAYLGSLAQGAAMWGLAFGFGSDFNINCVYYKCLFDLPFYIVSWPLLMILHVFVVYGIISYVFRNKNKIKK